MAILNVRSVPATLDQNSNSKPLIRMVYEEQTDKYCQPDTSVSENDTHCCQSGILRLTTLNTLQNCITFTFLTQK